MTEPQHISALHKANYVRSNRARLRAEIKAGDVFLHKLLEEPTLPDWLPSIRLEELLDFVPWLGTKTLQAMILGLPANLTATVGDLTYRKRRLLANSLGAWEARRPKAGKSGRSATPKTMSAGRSRRLPGNVRVIA
jgi:hypothetical protein